MDLARDDSFESITSKQSWARKFHFGEALVLNWTTTLIPFVLVIFTAWGPDFPVSINLILFLFPSCFWNKNLGHQMELHWLEFSTCSEKSREADWGQFRLIQFGSHVNSSMESRDRLGLGMAPGVLSDLICAILLF